MISTSGIGNDDCIVVLNGMPLETAFQAPYQYRTSIAGSELPAAGFGYLTLQSRSRGTTSAEAFLVAAPSGGFISIAAARQSGDIYAVERVGTIQTGPGLYRVDPATRIATLVAAPFSGAVQVIVTATASAAWVSTEGGATVTPVSLRDGGIGTPIPMPAGMRSFRIWSLPTMENCFAASRSPLDRSSAGDTMLYCDGAERPAKIPFMRRMLFEESGEAWAYDEGARRLFRVRVSAAGLATEGDGTEFSCSGEGLISGFGRIYCGRTILNKATGAVMVAGQAVLGVDERSGLIYAGQNYLGVFAAVERTLGFVTTRDPDLRDVMSLFAGNRLPVKLVPQSTEGTFQVLPGGRYAFLGRTSISSTLHIFQLQGLDRRIELTARGIVNAASLRTGPVAPGEIVSVFGAEVGPERSTPVPPPVRDRLGIGSWEGWGVTFDGTAAVALFGSPGQLNVVVPDSVRGKEFVEVQAFFGSSVSAPVRVPVARTQPAFFTLGTVNPNLAVGVFPDGAIAGLGRNARPGDLLSLFGTGFGGPGDVGLGDGSIPLNPLEINRAGFGLRICGQAAEVSYAGVAPGFRFGLFQFNVKVPNCGSQPGNRAAVVATVQGASSPEEVFLPLEP